MSKLMRWHRPKCASHLWLAARKKGSESWQGPLSVAAPTIPAIPLAVGFQLEPIPGVLGAGDGPADWQAHASPCRENVPRAVRGWARETEKSNGQEKGAQVGGRKVNGRRIELCVCAFVGNVPLFGLASLQ